MNAESLNTHIFGREFQGSITLVAKKYFRILVLLWSRSKLNGCPLVISLAKPLARCSPKASGSRVVMFFKILKQNNKSAHSRLRSRDGKFMSIRRLLYESLCNSGILFVKSFCTDSMASTSPRK